MNNEQFKQFYRDIEAVCRRYHMAGLVGVWFHGPTDNFGVMRVQDITDTATGLATFAVEGKLNKWMDELCPQRGTDGSINEISGGGDPIAN